MYKIFPLSLILKLDAIFTLARHVQLKIMPIPLFKTKCYQILVSKPFLYVQAVCLFRAFSQYRFGAKRVAMNYLLPLVSWSWVWATGQATMYYFVLHKVIHAGIMQNYNSFLAVLFFDIVNEVLPYFPLHYFRYMRGRSWSLLISWCCETAVHLPRDGSRLVFKWQQTRDMW